MDLLVVLQCFTLCEVPYRRLTPRSKCIVVDIAVRLRTVVKGGFLICKRRNETVIAKKQFSES